MLLTPRPPRPAPLPVVAVAVAAFVVVLAVVVALVVPAAVVAAALPPFAVAVNLNEVTNKQLVQASDNNYDLRIHSRLTIHAGRQQRSLADG